IGGQLIRKTLPKLLAENFSATEQNEGEATYCRIIKKDEGRVRWTEETAREIERKLRSFTPWPGIFTFYSISGKNENKRRIQLTKVEVVNESFESGKVYPELIVGTRTGGLRILRLKPEGKQEMDADSFLRGNLQIVGTVLE
ncbi:methionyl-tRNA formyltransferase, partial [bacterium]|nr:methionyl-tRNA formyltransferase [bacterium]